MPKDAFTLSDVREPMLTIVCEPCGRRGQYNVAKLLEKHGDAKILFLLSALTELPQDGVRRHLRSLQGALRGAHDSPALSPNLFRRLVFPQTDINCMSQEIVGHPGRMGPETPFRGFRAQRAGIRARPLTVPARSARQN